MGARLVGEVLSHWCHLSDRAFRVLVRMSHSALDEATGDEPAAHYDGGWPKLAATLGRAVPGGDDEDSKKARRRAAETVRRAVAEIVTEGAAVRTTQARPGHRQVYRLTLSPTATVGHGAISPTAAVPHSPTATVGHSAISPTATVAPRSAEELHAVQGRPAALADAVLAALPARLAGRVTRSTLEQACADLPAAWTPAALRLAAAASVWPDNPRKGGLVIGWVRHQRDRTPPEPARRLGDEPRDECPGGKPWASDGTCGCGKHERDPVAGAA